MSSSGCRTRSWRLAAPLLALLVFSWSVSASWDLHAASVVAGAAEHGAPVFVGATHPTAPPHVEGAQVAEARSCPACLFRVQASGAHAPEPVRGSAHLVPGLALAPCPPVRLAAGALACHRPRGPPAVPVRS